MVSRVTQITLAMLLIPSLTFAQNPPKSDPPKPAVSDAVIAKMFGPDSAELKFPLRVSLPKIGLVAAFGEFNITENSARVELLGPISIALTQVSPTAKEPDIHVFRGDKAILTMDSPPNGYGDLSAVKIISIELRNKQSIVKLSPQREPANNFVRPSLPPESSTPLVPLKEEPNKAVVELAVGTSRAHSMTSRTNLKRVENTSSNILRVEKHPNSNTEVMLVGVSPGRVLLTLTDQSDRVEQHEVVVTGTLPVEIRFSLRIDAKTPLSDLLPRAPKPAKLPAPFNEDLTKVPEIAFGEPISKNLTKMEAMEKTAHLLARANHLNRPKTDGFMEALIANRSDLSGLPFLMGEDCRTKEEQGRIFAVLADAFNQSVRGAKKQEAAGTADAVADMWIEMAGSLMAVNAAGGLKNDKINLTRANRDHFNRALVAALVQILMPESEPHRLGLARCLATIQHVDATKALARLVLFSPEEEVRAAAIDGLKLRRDQDYTQILLDGFRYPLPAVSKRAADAFVKLERKDLLPNLIEVLERPDPRLPAVEKRQGKDVTVVRELVKVNHQRNCMLCHAPGNTDNVPEGVLKIAVPLPTEPLPKPSEGGYQSAPPANPDIVVRIDMTYLRQDFALMLPVADAHPWPEMQRFDFLVRTRELTAAEAQAYAQPEEPGRLPPHHRAALYALRELTGRDTEPTAAGWRTLLKLPRQ